MSVKERFLSDGKMESSMKISKMPSQLGLPGSVEEEATRIYRRAAERSLLRGHSVEGISAACLYAACRKHDDPRTLDEIAESSRVDRKKISRDYKYLLRRLDIDVPPADPADYVPHLSIELNLSVGVKEKAIEIVGEAREGGLTIGRSPMGIAGAAIYIACRWVGEKVTQAEIAELSEVSEVTIRNRYKEMVDELDILKPFL